MSYSIRNVEDGQVVPLIGDTCDRDGGECCIGLTVDEYLACLPRVNGKMVAHSDESDGVNIVVPLVNFRVWKTSGVTVCPASRDLPCQLNGSEIRLEANIIPGNQIEIGDKVLELVEGSTPQKAHRRHLPPTPGVPILPTPPPKPKRAADRQLPKSQNGIDDPQKDSLKNELKEWCVDKLPNSEHEMLLNVKDPDQLASLASSYLTRHINLHTDIVMTSELADKIFKVLQEVALHRRDILRKFLGEVVEEVTSNNDETTVCENKQHQPVTALLVEILRQFLDPGSLVLLCLQLLRALSHIPGNVATMVTSQTTAAVLGSMAVYRSEENVQNFCLDILAKMATYIPPLGQKPPMRESSIDLIVMAMTIHKENLMVVQAAIRTLANLAASMHTLASSIMIDAPNPDLRNYMSNIMEVLKHLYDNTLDGIQEAMTLFNSDLNVKMDGRRYLFEYAKIDQLRSQQNIWEIQPESPRWHQENSVDSNDSHFEYDQDAGDETSNSKKLAETDKDNRLSVDEWEEDEKGGAPGILKKSRSFENLRTPERKVFFTSDLKESDLLASLSSSSSNQESPSPDDNNKDVGSICSVEIISRSRICPTTLLPVESSNGDLCFFPPQSTSDGDTGAPSPSTPPVPPRRPIQAPLVHINSLSDSDGDVFLDSPSHRHKDRDISSLPLSSKTFKCNSMSVPVDLTGFRYSTADKDFMKRLLTAQITCYVCSASIKGSDPQALKLLDMPLKELLARPGIPKGIGQFTESQLDSEASLMDIDPAAVISIIDAVRYQVLAFDLVRKTLQILIQMLSSALSTKMFSMTEEIIFSVAMDTAISSVLQDQNFILTLDKDLDAIAENFNNPAHIFALKEHIHRLSKRNIIKEDG